MPKLESHYADLKIKTKNELAFNGGDLTKGMGLKPGPLFGKILATLERKVAGDLANNHAVLQAEAQKMVERKRRISNEATTRD